MITTKFTLFPVGSTWTRSMHVMFSQLRWMLGRLLRAPSRPGGRPSTLTFESGQGTDPVFDVEGWVLPIGLSDPPTVFVCGFTGSA